MFRLFRLDKESCWFAETSERSSLLLVCNYLTISILQACLHVPFRRRRGIFRAPMFVVSSVLKILFKSRPFQMIRMRDIAATENGMFGRLHVRVIFLGDEIQDQELRGIIIWCSTPFRVRFP